MKKRTASQGGLRFTSTLERSNNKLWGCHFRVPGQVAKKLINGESRRVLCSLNDTAERHCALIPFGDGTFVITVNKGLREKLKLAFGVEVDVRLKKDTSLYGLPLPEEFRELLRQDKEGDKLFHALTRGRQRTLLYIIGSAKSPDKRVERSITIIRHLKSNNGSINYKQLSMSLKRPVF